MMKLSLKSPMSHHSPSYPGIPGLDRCTCKEGREFDETKFKCLVGISFQETWTETEFSIFPWVWIYRFTARVAKGTERALTEPFRRPRRIDNPREPESNFAPKPLLLAEWPQAIVFEDKCSMDDSKWNSNMWSFGNIDHVREWDFFHSHGLEWQSFKKETIFKRLWFSFSEKSSFKQLYGCIKLKEYQRIMLIHVAYFTIF